MCITSFLTVILHGQVPPALAGLALAYAAHISGVFQYTTRLVSETEVRFISVERINSYIRVRCIMHSSATCVENPMKRLFMLCVTVIFKSICSIMTDLPAS
jgi:hypothetical protein